MSRGTSREEYGDILILIRNFSLNAKITVSKLKYSPITVKLAIFKMAATKLLYKNQIIRAGLKIHSNAIILLIYCCTFHCWHNFNFIAHINCPNSRWQPSLLTTRVFYHNCQITRRGKCDFTKLVDRMCLARLSSGEYGK